MLEKLTLEIWKNICVYVLCKCPKKNKKYDSTENHFVLPKLTS